MNYQRWIEHFNTNRLNRPEPDWSAPFTLPESKRAALARSLAEYQLGDGGGECRLIAGDSEHFRGSAENVRAVVDAWFAEEREHSRLLAGAVRRVGGTFIKSTFAFQLFNAVRRALGVQFEMLVLLIVEIVSTGYYRLIRRYVGDEPIADMCKLILRDEARHIDFHCDRLAARHPDGVGVLWTLLFHALAHTCATFLWHGHGRCLRTLGATRAELFGHVRCGSAKFLGQLASRSDATSREEASEAVADALRVEAYAAQ